jgi:hypothetical protein
LSIGIKAWIPGCAGYDKKHLRWLDGVGEDLHDHIVGECAGQHAHGAAQKGRGDGDRIDVFGHHMLDGFIDDGTGKR